MTKLELNSDYSQGRKLLACGLALSLSLYSVPLSSSEAFGDEGDAAKSETQSEIALQDDAQKEESADQQAAKPSAGEVEQGGDKQAADEGANESAADGATGAENVGKDEAGLGDETASVVEPDPSKEPEGSTTDSPKLSDENADTGEAVSADEQDALTAEDVEEVHDGATDEEIAETLALLEGSSETAEEEGASLLSLSGSSSAKTYGGATMFETAVAEAKAAFSQSDTVIIAGPGDAWVDALASAGLAGALNCPILFTEDDSLHPATKTALKDLKVKNAIIVGGTAAISNQVVEELNTAGVSLKKRLGGADCFDTQMKIYEYGVDNNLWNYDMAIIATGGHYGDALSVSPIAYDKKVPIFLVDNGELRTPQKKALSTAAKSGKFSTTAIVGGTVAVSVRTKGFLDGMSKCTRYGGATQYETSTEIAKWAVKSQGFSWNNAAFTTGAFPYDALAGSVLQGKSKSVMLLVGDTSSATIKEASANQSSISSIRFFGGTAAIAPSVRTYIMSCLSDKITYEHAGISYSSMFNLEYASAKNYLNASGKYNTKADVSSGLNPDLFGYEDDDFYQFAVIDSGYSGKVSAAQVNKFIARYGSDAKLAGMGQAFVDAAKTYGVNEVYLVAHAILESGWGTSDLAMGYKYDGKTKVNGKTYKAGTYYNFFGIGAVDSGPLTGGRALAIMNGWNTPEKAIKGAAKWIADGYLNNSYNQNTLYKMRWNYTQAASEKQVWKQYATSTTWARSISRVMADLYAYNNIDKGSTGLKFIVPLYS